MPHTIQDFAGSKSDLSTCPILDTTAIVASDVLRASPYDHQIRKDFYDILVLPVSLRDTSQAFTLRLVNYVQEADPASIRSPVLHKIIAPYVVPALRAQPDAASVR